MARRAGRPAAKAAPEPLPNSFDSRYLSHVFEVAPERTALAGWTRDRVREGRAAQLAGSFSGAAELGTIIKTDASIFAALLNRMAPGRGLPRIVVPARDPGVGKRIAEEAEVYFHADDGPGLPPAFLADVDEREAVHGLAVAQLLWTAREDGSRVDPRPVLVPMQSLTWNAYRGRLQCSTLSDGLVDVVHGDGKWVIFSQTEAQPWTWGALVALADIWVDRMFGRRDRSQAAEAHGHDKWIGTLPQGIAVDSAEGKKMIEQMKRLYQARSGMLKPFGSEIERNVSTSSAWQIFREILTSNASDAARVLLGQDATVGQSSAAPGINSALFGVRNDIVEGSLRSRERGINTGILRPWSVVNFGRADLAPRQRWLMPDPDEDARRESLAKRHGDLARMVKEYRAEGFDVTQVWIDARAKELGVEPPKLAELEPAPPAAAPEPPAEEDDAPAQGAPPSAD